MASASIIAVGNDEQVSADIVLADGSSTVVNLRPASINADLPARASAVIQIKASDGTYLPVSDGLLTATDSSRQLPGPATYRVVRRAVASGSFGVDKN